MGKYGYGDRNGYQLRSFTSAMQHQDKTQKTMHQAATESQT